MYSSVQIAGLPKAFSNADETLRKNFAEQGAAVDAGGSPLYDSTRAARRGWA